MDTKEFDILDVLLILAKHKKFIFFTTLIVSVLIVTYSLLVTQTWESKTVIISISNNSDFSVEKAIVGQLSSSFLKHENSSKDVIPIIESRTFLEKIIKEFDLLSYLELENEEPLLANFLAVKSLREKIITIDEDLKKGTISIKVITDDKFLSANIANYITSELDRFNREERLTKSKENRIFLENRINELEVDISKLRDDLQKFEIENNVLSINTQVQKQLNFYAELIVKYKEKEIEVEYLQKLYAEDNKALLKALTEKSILQEQITLFEKSENLPKYYINLDIFPQLVTDYYGLKFKFKIQQKIYETLYPQYEFAKLSELKDTPSIQIIDKAIPAGKRSFPSRGLMCILAFIMAIIISSSYVIILEAIKSYLLIGSKQNKFIEIKKRLLNK